MHATFRWPANASLALVALAFVVFACPAHAQEFGISAHNQTEYSNSTEDDLEILLEWLDVDTSYGDFIAAIRYEAFQPPRALDPLGDEIREGFPFRFIEMSKEWGTFRAGNAYTLFGRGLTLNLFEDRDVRIDSNLDGIKYRGEYRWFGLTAMSGRVRSTTTARWPTTPTIDRKDLVHAAELTVRPAPEVRVAGSIATDRYPGTSGDIVREMYGGRVEAFLGPVVIYAEEARLENPGRDDGEGTYVSGTLSGSLGDMTYGLLAEARDYEDFAFHSSDGRIYLNSPPAGTREHAYTLLNRHPHNLNTLDERGYQFEASLTPLEGITATLNHSNTEDHSDRVWYREYYADVNYESTTGRILNLIGVLDHQKVRSSDTENITLIGEGTVELTEVVSMRLEFGNQHVKDGVHGGEYDDHLAVIEVSRSPGVTAGLSVEWTNRSELQFLPGEDTTTSWVQGNIGLQLVEGTDLAVLYGARQAGYYCVGGRCRYEPAFEGLEVKFIAHF